MEQGGCDETEGRIMPKTKFNVLDLGWVIVMSRTRMEKRRRESGYARRECELIKECVTVISTYVM